MPGSNIEENIKKEQAAKPSITPAELKAYFVNLYQDLLSNPAVSGLALWENWSALNPNPPAAANPYDWTYVDDAFDQASAWNARNPTKAPKTIQLVPLPGFQTPPWLLAQIPSCDGLFRAPVQTPPKTCGKATFAGFVEGRGVRELANAVERRVQKLLADLPDRACRAIWVKAGVRLHIRRRTHRLVRGDDPAR